MGLTTLHIANVDREGIKNEFLSIKTPRELANLLKIKYSLLVYHLYKKKPKDRYTRFTIPKKSGGERTITAPTTRIRNIQKSLSDILISVYQPKVSVHGFLPQRSIITNANIHKGKRFVLNIDLENFFPSINFGRVRGLFLSEPYKLPPSVATVISQICCYKDEEYDELPQGAPSSPIITNMIAAKMDTELRIYAQKYNCNYTRYADDITFSCTRKSFPKEIATFNDNKVELNKTFVKIILTNGFKINEKKIRMRTKFERQEVTGITVNQKLNVKRKYIRQIRAILFAWNKFGYENANKEFLEKYSKKSSGRKKTEYALDYYIKGKLNYLSMVKGKKDLVYLNLINKYRSLNKLEPLKLFTVDEKIDEISNRIINIEKEIDFTIEPIDFSFIHEKYSDIMKELSADSKTMRKYEKQSNFSGFCSRLFAILETSIKCYIRHNYNAIMETANQGDFGVNKKNIMSSHMLNLIWLFTQHHLNNLVEGNWLTEKKNYWFHNNEDPYKNYYCILHYIRTVRNLSEHREGYGFIETITRVEKNLEDLKTNLAKAEKSTDTSKLIYNIQNLKNTKIILEQKNYSLLEEVVIKYLKITLSA